MSLNAATIRLLLAAGKDASDLLIVAQAMERGPNASAVFDLIEDMQGAAATDAACGEAVLALSEEINAVELDRLFDFQHHRIERSRPKDGNRERRGLPEREWRVLRQRIFERDAYACTYCGSKDDLTCDHVLALIRGGTNDENNLTTACRSCNSSKGDRLLEEWQCL